MDCEYDPKLTSDEWGKIAFTPILNKRYPISGSIELTERCNLNCVQCYINQPLDSRIARSKEMDTARVFGILDQIAEAGCVFLMMTGGEIFVRPDFFDIYDHAKKLGLLLTLFTNGTLITDHVAERLADSPPLKIDITLYGMTAETYESVTRVPGSFRRCMRAIEKLKERNLNFALKTVLTKGNLSELKDMQKFAEDLNIKFRYDGILWPRTDGTSTPYAERISINELVQLDKDDPQRFTEWRDMIYDSSKRFTRSEKVYYCGAGIHSFHIDASGKVSMCLMLKVPSFDLAEMSFVDAWERFGQERELRRSKHTACETCDLGALCMQCPGWSQVVHGDKETPVDYICSLAKLRLDQFQI